MTFALVGPLCVCLLAVAPGKGTRLEQGQKAFADGDYAQALRALDAAAVEGTDLEKIQLLRAQAFAALQDFAHAEEAFALALEANPEASLDPTRVDPSVVKMLDGLRARTKGTIRIRSTPPAAEVTLDGKLLGPAPVEAYTVIGRHKLEAKWPAGGNAQAEVLVRPRRETYLEWVQGAAVVGVAPPAPVPVPPPEGKGLHPFGEVRGRMEIGGGIIGGLEIGGGLEFPYFRAGVDLSLFPSFGLTVRPALVVPIVPLLSGFVEAELAFTFAGGLSDEKSSVGIGGTGGIEWHPIRFLGVFAGIGGRHLFPTGTNFLNTDRAILSAGVRMRVP